MLADSKAHQFLCANRPCTSVRTCERAADILLRPTWEVQPNSLNFLKFPLVAMFWNMIFYLPLPQIFHTHGHAMRRGKASLLFVSSSQL